MQNAQSPLTVERWLSIATDGLCDAAKARVCDEIETHYDDRWTRWKSLV